jgi:hypothetical protein
MKKVKNKDIISDNAEKELRISDISNRYLVEYLNKGGANRQTYIEAINEDAARNGFFIYNDGTILSITDIRHL